MIARDRAMEARFLRIALGQATSESHRLLRRPGLRHALLALAPAIDLPGGLAVSRNLQTFESEYLALFEVGAPAPPVPLRECHWNRQRGANRILDENQRFYRTFGMAVRPETADHLSSQLAFVELLSWAAAERERRGAPAGEVGCALADYVELHLRSWVPAAAAAIKRLRPRPVFLALLATLELWVHRLGETSAAAYGSEI